MQSAERVHTRVCTVHGEAALQRLRISRADIMDWLGAVSASGQQEQLAQQPRLHNSHYRAAIDHGLNAHRSVQPLGSRRGVLGEQRKDLGRDGRGHASNEASV